MAKKSSIEIRQQLRQFHLTHNWLFASGEVDRDMLRADLYKVLRDHDCGLPPQCIEQIIQNTCDIVTNLQGLDPVYPNCYDSNNFVFLDDSSIELFLDSYIPTVLLRALTSEH